MAGADAKGHSQFWAVVRISSGFFFLFMAFNTVNGLVSTLVSDNRLVQAASSLLYGVFTLSTIVAPAIIERLGSRMCMFLGSIPYVLLVFANIHPCYELFVPAYIGVGVGAALLWTSQGIEMSRAAVAEAARTGQSVEAINNRFTGFFWSCFQFNGALGLLIASTVLVAAPNFKDAVAPLFIGFGVVGACGVVILSPCLAHLFNGKDAVAAGAAGSSPSDRLLDGASPASSSGVVVVADAESASAVDAADGSASATSASSAAGNAAPAVKVHETSMFETLRFACRSRRMQLAIPIIFYNGASLGFFGTMYPLSYQDKLDADGHVQSYHLLPPQMVGYVAATFYIANSLCSYAWGQLVPRFGRRWLFAGVLATHSIFFTVVLLFVLKPEVLNLPHASVGAYAVVFLMAIVFALGDSVLESQLPALVQSPAFLPLERDRACAVSNSRLWQSLGFTVQFAIGIVAPGNVWLQAAVLVPMMLLSLTALFVLDRCVHPIQEAGRGYGLVAGEGAAAVAAGKEGALTSPRIGYGAALAAEADDGLEAASINSSGRHGHKDA